MKNVISDIVHIVRKVGAYQLYMLSKEKKIEYKGDGERNPVTEVDKESERMIIEYLSKLYPEFGFLAEEGTKKMDEKPLLFCVDPLDGTVNYSHGFPMFCISIAVIENGNIKAGVIYDPLRNELFIAERGKGAFLNDERIRVSREDRLVKSLLATGFPYELLNREKNNVDLFSRLVYETQGLRRCGSAALDLAYVACGRLDGFWELGLKPWDMAAGSLMVEEAGGTVTDFSGKPFNVFQDRILATNGVIHKKLLEVLFEEGYGSTDSNP